jgi:hypothetical protein
MRAYGRKPQHPKGHPDIKVHRRLGERPWWEAEGAQPEKGAARAEAKKEIERATGGEAGNGGT